MAKREGENTSKAAACGSAVRRKAVGRRVAGSR